MRIIPYECRYRDDLIFMVLEAKNALGRVPTLNADLLDILGCYLNRGEMFWIALNDDQRVIGCVGYNAMEDPQEVKLHRLYVKIQSEAAGDWFCFAGNCGSPHQNPGKEGHSCPPGWHGIF